MIYQAELTIPAQTPRENPVVVSFTIPRGVVNRLSILFPLGCAALAHLVIKHNEYQIWPTTPERSFVGDNTYITFEESYELPDAWNTVQVVGWNEDDSYPHTLNVWLGVNPQGTTWGLYFPLGLPGWPEE